MTSVTVHSDGPSHQVTTITVTKTGANTGTLLVQSSTDQQTQQPRNLNSIEADPTTISMRCTADTGEILVPDVPVAVVVQPRQGALPLATITFDIPLEGAQTQTYDLRVGEDQLVKNFLASANFPPLADS